MCVRLGSRTAEQVNQDSGLHTGNGGSWFSSRRLLTDSGDGRRALELQAWVQLACPLPGPGPGAGGWAWPGAGASAKEAAGPAPGPGA